jgi:hypothetical protein
MIGIFGLVALGFSFFAMGWVLLLRSDKRGTAGWTFNTIQALFALARFKLPNLKETKDSDEAVRLSKESKMFEPYSSDPILSKQSQLEIIEREKAAAYGNAFSAFTSLAVLLSLLTLLFLPMSFYSGPDTFVLDYFSEELEVKKAEVVAVAIAIEQNHERIEEYQNPITYAREKQGLAAASQVAKTIAKNSDLPDGLGVKQTMLNAYNAENSLLRVFFYFAIGALSLGVIMALLGAHYKGGK